ncbi:NAD(P)-dependent oxidoreductase [Nonomuraea turcica]|uniref:NAD(P)-dependent oxidoreductase n=1 Tax=Nonomuraea sp. G32 TaxID=3067274 RepID=UPI00273B59E0|nr:NAD(P)-dependent oxidoreductase [Nonomuraea sp. G32]MDP4506931.1 NAD(P)-dependent oxidoreductase [Nonomuraea sp. G32]
MTAPTLGFVGLGHMGGAMAGRLVARGHRVHGTSRTRAHADALVSAGLRWHDTPRQVAEEADVLFSSIPDDAVLNAIANGPDGVLSGLAPCATWVETSTVSPQTSRYLAVHVRARGATMLDTPVSGSVPQAQAGTLTIMAGGDDNAYSRVEPILRELGTPTHVGPNGQGLTLKLAINISLAVQMIAFAEGLLLADRSGVNRELALQLMTDSAIGSPMLKARAPLVLHLPDEARFDLRLMRKDLELALDAARKLDIPLPTADRADEVLLAARTLGFEQRDLAAVFQVLDHMTPRPPTPQAA